MTRRSIATAFASLLVGLFVAVNTSTGAALAAGEAAVNRVCYFTDADAYTCSVFAADGTWMRTEALTDGEWTVTAQASQAASADAPCGKYAPEHCETMMDSPDAALIPATTESAGSPVHILAGNGMGQEQFEAISGQPDALFLVAAPTAQAAHVPSGYAPENYEQMLAQQPSN